MSTTPADPKTPALATTPEVPAPKKPHGLTGRKASEKQLEGLRKGMAALAARRDAMNKAKEEGTFKPEDFQPKPKVKKARGTPYIPVDPALKALPRPPDIIVPRARKLATKDDLEEMKRTIAEIKESQHPREVEKIVEKIVEVPKEVVREVVKEKKLSGSAMLDAIFFSK